MDLKALLFGFISSRFITNDDIRRNNVPCPTLVVCSPGDD